MTSKPKAYDIEITDSLALVSTEYPQPECNCRNICYVCRQLLSYWWDIIYITVSFYSII